MRRTTKRLAKALGELHYYEALIPFNDEEAYEKNRRIKDLRTTVLSLKKGYNIPMSKFDKLLDKAIRPKKKK